MNSFLLKININIWDVCAVCPLCVWSGAEPNMRPKYLALWMLCNNSWWTVETTNWIDSFCIKEDKYYVVPGCFSTLLKCSFMTGSKSTNNFSNPRKFPILLSSSCLRRSLWPCNARFWVAKHFMQWKILWRKSHHLCFSVAIWAWRST